MRAHFIAGLLAAAALLPAAALAADLPTPPPAAPPAPVAVPGNWYVELFGGAALPGSVDGTMPTEVSDVFSTLDVSPVSDPTGSGFAGGGAVGVKIGPPGLSAEIDGLYAHSPYSEDDGSFDTFSLMANLKYTAHLTPSLDIYGAAGVGSIHGHDLFNGDVYTDETKAGYQLIAGAGFNLNPQLALIAEYRYQNTFSPFDIVEDLGGDTETHANNVLLVGVKYSP